MFENHHVMPHFGSSLFGAGGLLLLLTVDLRSRRPTYQAGSLGRMVTAKNRVLHGICMVPFLISYHRAVFGTIPTHLHLLIQCALVL